MSFNISETRYVIKKLIMHVTNTSKLFIDNPIKKYIAIFLQFVRGLYYRMVIYLDIGYLVIYLDNYKKI